LGFFLQFAAFHLADNAKAMLADLLEDGNSDVRTDKQTEAAVAGALSEDDDEEQAALIAEQKRKREQAAAAKAAAAAKTAPAAKEAAATAQDLDDHEE
jgi:hypothetical protein